MNYLTSKANKFNKAIVVYVRDGVEVVSFPAFLNSNIPSIDYVEALVGDDVAPVVVVKGVTTERVANGEFKVLKDGKATDYTITNSCMGMSGNGPNVYLISKNGTIKQTGLTLQKAKKMVAHWLK